jgi:lipoprotein LprG
VAGCGVCYDSASTSGDFELSAQITDDDELRQLALTGVFYKNATANTYTVGFDDYGTTKDVQAPCP